MLPLTDDLTVLEVESQPSLTWRLRTDNNMGGTVDGIEAVKQAVRSILSTERYGHMIYPWDYGVELQGLIGEPLSYVLPELKRRITEALTQDDRIDSVDGFEFDTTKKGIVAASFTVYGNYGDFGYTQEVGV